MIRKEKPGSKWNGHKARPNNRAKTWGTKDRCPQRDRRSWKNTRTTVSW
jgi:hypothetical protein